jgi:hypothetical protein
LVGSLVRGSTLGWLTLAAAIVVFCIVQDRVTAAGARRYVAVQRQALARGGPAVTVDDVMRPAIARSVRLGLASAAAVLVVGLGAGFIARRRWPNA